MRLAMYEILYMPEIPNGAAINEAVEIAKKYEDPDVVRFINGILGSFVRNETADAPPAKRPPSDAPDRGQLFLQLLEGHVKIPHSVGAQGVAVELIGSVPWEDADPAHFYIFINRRRASGAAYLWRV
mgnify:CR=1 FL=1